MAKTRWRHFWQFVDRTGDCWLWMAGQNGIGYGQLRTPYGVKLATHVAWFSVHKVWPRQINHHCDNPICVRPQHLYEGNAQGNIADAIVRGRFMPHGKVTTPHDIQLNLWDQKTQGRKSSLTKEL